MKGDVGRGVGKSWGKCVTRNVCNGVGGLEKGGGQEAEVEGGFGGVGVGRVGIEGWGVWVEVVGVKKVG